MTFGTYIFKKISFLKENSFPLKLFLIFSLTLIALPWIRIQIEPKSWIRIQIQCIWIHNTGYNSIRINEQQRHWQCCKSSLDNFKKSRFGYGIRIHIAAPPFCPGKSYVTEPPPPPFWRLQHPVYPNFAAPAPDVNVKIYKIKHRFKFQIQ